jgi:hypothetical protein
MYLLISILKTNYFARKYSVMNGELKEESIRIKKYSVIKTSPQCTLMYDTELYK